MGKRTRNDIIYDMLEKLFDSRNGLIQTRLMYKANLIHSQIKKYLSELMEAGFVDKSKDRYHITDKGIKYLQKLREVRHFEKTFGF